MWTLTTEKRVKRRTLEHSLSAENLGTTPKILSSISPACSNHAGSLKQSRSRESIIPLPSFESRRQARPISISSVMSVGVPSQTARAVSHSPLPRTRSFSKRKPVPNIDDLISPTSLPPEQLRSRALFTGSDPACRYSALDPLSSRADMKRLLSKPAFPSNPNGAPALSLPSDSDFHVGGGVRGWKSKRVAPMQLSSRPGSVFTLASTSRDTLDGPKHAPSKNSAHVRQVERAELTFRAACASLKNGSRDQQQFSEISLESRFVPLRGARSPDRAEKKSHPECNDSPEALSLARGENLIFKTARIRNVLRRRPTVSRETDSPHHHHQTVTVIETLPSSSELPASNRYLSESRLSSSEDSAAHCRSRAPGLTVDSSLSPYPISIAPSSGNSIGTSKSRSRSCFPSPLPSPIPAVTPARSIAEAYKHQAERREMLASVANGGENAVKVDDAGTTFVRGTEDDQEAERSPTPYFTILGSSSGKIVAVGGPDDASWDVNVGAYVAPAICANRQPVCPERAGPGSLRRSLSRKLSGKRKKLTASTGSGGAMEREAAEFARSTVASPGAGYQERKSKSFATDPIALTPSKSAPQQVTYLETKDARDGDKGRHRPETQKSDSEPHFHKQDRQARPGVKFWRLVRRISSGVLREKFQENEVPPPVPALPKEVARERAEVPRSDEVLSGETSPNRILRLMQSRSPLPTPTKSHSHPHSKARRAALGKTSTRPSPVSGPATGSSSPVSSSEVGSPHCFSKTHSPRSSSSSNGNESPPPLPLLGAMVGKHIIPPSELCRFQADEEKYQASQSSSRVTSPDGSPMRRSPVSKAQPSLPTPPRRQLVVLNPDSRPHSTSSTTIPVFRTDNAINTFGQHQHPFRDTESKLNKRRPALTLLVPRPQLPPARPRRSTLRAPTSARMVSDEGHDHVSLHRHPDLRTSVSSKASTAHQRPRSNSLGSLLNMTLSSLTFREIDNQGERSHLSEKEKAMKWDDLLEKSARAGGTLHFGEANLASSSDAVRLSVC